MSANLGGIYFLNIADAKDERASDAKKERAGWKSCPVSKSNIL